MSQLNLLHPDVEPGRYLSAWFTPRETAERIVQWAAVGVSAALATAPISILEPSCGEGSLLRAMDDLWPNEAFVTGVDINPHNVDHCKSRPWRLASVDFHCADFLSWKPARANDHGQRFDLCIMNPPFEDGQTERHVLHALRFCNRVVCHGPLTTLEGKDRLQRLWKNVRLHRLAICSGRPKYAGDGGKTAMCTMDLSYDTHGWVSPSGKRNMGEVEVEFWT